SGAAQSGDSVDLLGGTDTLILGDGGNTIAVANIETVTGGAGVDVVTFTGTAGNFATLVSGLAAADTVINETASGVTLTGATIAPSVINKSTISINGSSTLSNGLTNAAGATVNVFN